MLFKEVVDIYIENHIKQINTKWRFTDYHSRWDIALPLGLKWLMSGAQGQRMVSQENAISKLSPDFPAKTMFNSLSHFYNPLVIFVS
jgi:hypothetical protein